MCFDFFYKLNLFFLWSLHSFVLLLLVLSSPFFLLLSFYLSSNVLPKMECSCLHGKVIENGCTRNPLTLVYGLYLYLYMYRCGCTYWVTLRVFSWGMLQQQSSNVARTDNDIYVSQPMCWCLYLYVFILPLKNTVWVWSSTPSLHPPSLFRTMVYNCKGYGPQWRGQN